MNFNLEMKIYPRTEANSGQPVVIFGQAIVSAVAVAGGWDDWDGWGGWDGEEVAGAGGNDGNGGGDNHSASSFRNRH